MFEDKQSNGSRLGISYMRAQEPFVDILLDKTGRSVRVSQYIEDRESISGVVWDAGLLVADFIISEKARGVAAGSGTHILDLGCGTGIVGTVVSAVCEGVELTFSDIPSVKDIVQANLFMADASERVSFVPYDWCSAEPPPPTLLSPQGGTATDRWHTVYCSDLLYDENMLRPLLDLLKVMNFQRCVFGYKKRHADAELQFWRELSQWCCIDVLPLAGTAEGEGVRSTDRTSVALLNCTQPMIQAGGGLFAVIATPLVTPPPLPNP